MTDWRFPLEVIEVVFDLCAEDPQPDYQMLTTLTLVSSMLRLRAKRNLLRHVVITNPAQAKAFLDNAAGAGQYLPLALLGRLARNVETMTLSVDPEAFCPKYFVDVMEFRNVRNLELKSMCIKDITHLRRLVRAFPQARCLTLNDVGFLRPRSKVPHNTSQPWVPVGMSSVYIQSFRGSPEQFIQELGFAAHQEQPPKVEYLQSAGKPPQ
ncbi:hypothetical protein C8Q79DRAFT_592766 [Trametes meyenii]|nr:hypothetical protein C8Q79DRAFT_592766 [Trametes meyenii]